MTVKLIAAAVILSLLGFGAWKLHDVGYQAGVADEKVRTAAAVNAAREEEAAKVKEVIKWKEKIKVVYRDRVQTIHTVEDPTGCLGTDLRDVGLGIMLRTGDSETRPGADDPS